MSTTSKTITLTLFIATTLFASCNAAANATSKPLFPAILIFGDSTVDTGNNNYPLPTIFRAEHFPYGMDLPDGKANGRFSNGKLISDIIATKLNIKEFIPPFLQPNLSDQDILTGVCFASAGAGYDDLTSLSTQAIRVSEQPNMFKSYIARLKGIVGDKKAMEIINNALVVISAGPNDFILNYYDIPSRRLEYPFISGYQDFILKRLENIVRVTSKIFISSYYHTIRVLEQTIVTESFLIISFVNLSGVYAGALQSRFPEYFGWRFAANGVFTDPHDC